MSKQFKLLLNIKQRFKMTKVNIFRMKSTPKTLTIRQKVTSIYIPIIRILYFNNWLKLDPIFKKNTIIIVENIQDSIFKTIFSEH